MSIASRRTPKLCCPDSVVDFRAFAPLPPSPLDEGSTIGDGSPSGNVRPASNGFKLHGCNLRLFLFADFHEQLHMYVCLTYKCVKNVYQLIIKCNYTNTNNIKAIIRNVSGTIIIRCTIQNCLFSGGSIPVDLNLSRRNSNVTVKLYFLH